MCREWWEEAEEPYRTACKFLVLTIRVLIIGRLAVSYHGHHIWECYTWPVVFVCVKKDSEAFKFIHRTKDGSPSRSLLGNPQCHSVTMKVPFTMYLEFEFDLSGFQLFDLRERVLNEIPTSQFVAVRGTFEKIQPIRDCRSEASRMYLQRRLIVGPESIRETRSHLSARTMVSPPNSNHRLCMSVSKYGFCVSVSRTHLHMPSACRRYLARRILTGVKLCVRSCRIYQQPWFIQIVAIRTGILLKFGSVAAATVPKLPNSNPIEARHDMYILLQKHLQARSKSYMCG